MSEPQPLDVLRVLLDPVRLAVAGAAATGSVRHSDLADQLDVEPKAVAKAVADLRAVGLLTDDGVVDRDALRGVATTLPAPAGSLGEPVPGPWSEDEARILGRFFDGDRLIEIPSSRSKRLLVLEKIALAFEPGRRYPERDVNFTIQLVHPDYAAIRRYMIDEGLMDRADGAYWRIGGRVDTAPEDVPELDTRSPLAVALEGVELRAYDRSMVTALTEAADDDRIPRYMGDMFATPYTVDDAEMWIDVATKAVPVTQYAVFVDGRLAGGLGGFPGSGEQTGTVEIGWWLDPDYWGRGIMSACAATLVDEFIGVRGYMRLWAPVMAPNVASKRVAERAGLQLESIAPSVYLKAGVRHDQWNYGITRAQWLAAR